MAQPVTQYALSGGAQIAYQVIGDGPIDVVYPTTGATPIDMVWEHQGAARNLTRIASFCRLIQLDARGFGSSERVDVHAMPALQSWMDDMLAVMDAAGCARPAVLATSETGLPAMLLAASHPERVSALALVNCFARYLRDEEHPWGMPADALQRYSESYEASWSTIGVLNSVAPSVAADAASQEWAMRAQRLSSTPATGVAITRYYWETDLSDILPGITVPTLVVHRKDAWHVRAGHGRYIAQRIPGAKYVELDGADSIPFLGQADDIIDELEEFFTGARQVHDVDRVLATVMFTDIVGSTEQAADLGDRRWRDLLDAHDAVVRRQLDLHKGRAVKGTGDGFLATFDGPARAIRCAIAIRDGLLPLGIQIRAGLHTGEVELRDGDVGGIAVHIGARIGAMADPAEVLVSRTVKDLVAGSGIGFVDRGVHALKGVPDEWQLYAAQG